MCARADSCTAPYVCQSNQCVTPAPVCPPASALCPCLSGACNIGLVCNGGVCQQGPTSGPTPFPTPRKGVWWSLCLPLTRGLAAPTDAPTPLPPGFSSAPTPLPPGQSSAPTPVPGSLGGCYAGTAGCACDSGVCRATGTSCVGGICTFTNPSACAPGADGCKCAVGNPQCTVRGAVRAWWSLTRGWCRTRWRRATRRRACASCPTTA
jgi:hypothetical protein